MLPDILYYATPLTVSIYSILALICWGLMLTGEYAINGGQLGRGRWWAFECFWEELQMNTPGGIALKIQNLKDRGYADVDKKMAREKLGSAFSFWTIQMGLYLAIAFLIGPLFIVGIVASVIIAGPFVYLKIQLRKNRLVAF